MDNNANDRMIFAALMDFTRKPSPCRQNERMYGDAGILLDGQIGVSFPHL
jgi:hypothetical protein